MSDVTLPGEDSVARQSLAAKLVLVPLVCALAGLIIRYLAYVGTIPDASPSQFVAALCEWDCNWYVGIAEAGYDVFPVAGMINAGNWAFFPAYPLLVGALARLSGLPVLYVAFGLSTLLAMLAARLAWPLLGGSIRAYILFSVFLLAGPFAMYFTTFYTEVLFLLLTIGVFRALDRRRFLLAGLIAAVLSATRIVGVFIVFAMLVEVWRAHRESGGTWRDFVPATLQRPDLVLAFALAPLGLFAYMAFLHLQVGDALAFSHVQRAWGRPLGNPLEFWWLAISDFPKEGYWPTPSQQLATATLVGLLACLALIWRRRFAMALYGIICLVLPLFAGMASTLRFTAGLAPVPLVLADLAGRSRIVAALSVLVLLVGGYFGTVGWLTGYLSLV